MKVAQTLRDWRRRPVKDNERRAWETAAAHHDAALGQYIVIACAVGLMGFLAIGSWALWWTAVTVFVLSAVSPAITWTARLVRAEPVTQGWVMVEVFYTTILHAVWTSMALALWFMAAGEDRALGLVAAMCIAVHICLNHHQRIAILLASVLPPIAALLVMAIDAVISHAGWPWLIGTLAMIGSLGGVITSLIAASAKQYAAEREALDNLARWELASRASKAGIWEYDYAQKRLVWSDSIQAMLLADPHAHWALGADFAAMAPPEWRDKVNESFGAARDSGALQWSMEYPVIRADGVEIWVENSLSFQRDANGAVVRLVGFVQDATERRAQERAALSANRAKTAFLAAMSHEIRTPMNAVLGMTELLGRENLSVRARDHVATLRQSGRLLMTILDDLLDLSKIEAGRMELETTAFDLPNLLDQAERLWRPRAEEKGLRLRFNTPRTLPHALMGDPARLQQILFNLLSNAVKFTDDGEVTLNCVADFDDDATARLVIRVADTGIGMSKDQRERLFTPYTQVDVAIARRLGGSGLGLAISQKLAEAMGGKIQVTSAPGMGSIFTLTIALPIASTSAVTAPLAESREDTLLAPERPLSILLAEDHPVNQQIVCAYLAPLGCDVMIAKDGHEVIALAQEQTFDVILMDINMPKISGIDATISIRANAGPNAATPIIGVTADAFEDQRRKGYAAGMVDYVTKPITPQALLSAIASAIATTTPAAAA